MRLTDFDGNQRRLSDGVGLSNYGGLLYEEGDIDVNIFSLYSQFSDRVTDKLFLDIGARYDLIQHKGLKYNSAPLDVGEGGFDSCLLYTSPSPRDRTRSRMPSSA